MAVSRSTGSGRIRNYAYAAFVLVISAFGFLAMEAGQHNLPAWNQSGREEAILAARAKADAGVSTEALTSSEKGAFPAWVNLMGRASSSKYAYGSDGMSEASQYYAVMPSQQKAILSTHMALGGLCIIIGLFQFWPAFRLRHRKLHRWSGVVYTLAGLTAMAMGVLHLLHAGVANTYQGFVFHVGLWVMVFNVVVCLLAAWWYVRERDFARHLGWQAVGYGYLLTAPFQRYDWIVLGWIFPDLTQGTANSVVNVALFWQCQLFAYLLFAWNRAACAPRRAPKAPVSTSWRAAHRLMGSAVVALLVITTCHQYLIEPYIPADGVVRGLLPPELTASMLKLYEDGWRAPIFAVAIIIAACSAFWSLLFDEAAPRARNRAYIAALIAAAVQCAWGWEQGVPSAALPSGGTFYLLSGLSLGGFAVAAAVAHRQGKPALCRERTIFLLCFTFSPSIYQWQLMLYRAFDFVPPVVFAKGHGYMLAANSGLSISMVAGTFAAIYGRETAARAIA